MSGGNKHTHVHHYILPSCQLAVSACCPHIHSIPVACTPITSHPGCCWLCPVWRAVCDLRPVLGAHVLQDGLRRFHSFLWGPAVNYCCQRRGELSTWVTRPSLKLLGLKVPQGWMEPLWIKLDYKETRQVHSGQLVKSRHWFNILRLALESSWNSCCWYP